MKKVAAYLEKGKNYLVLDLDENLHEIGRKVVSHSDLPREVTDKCDSYEPHESREVPIQSSISHPKARDAALITFDYWSKMDVTREEAFDHALAEYFIARGMKVGDAD